MRKVNIFTEASGSMVAPALIRSLKEAGLYVTASDISENNAGTILADSYVKVPPINDPNIWVLTLDILLNNKIKWIIPSLDEMLLLWSKKDQELIKNDISIIISPKETINTFSDKWKTYEAFLNSEIPTPRTELKQKFPLIKPRFGRGSKGVKIVKDKIDMDGKISQEIVKGEELTVDCLFDLDGNPIYIVPRKRKKIIDGKSVEAEIISQDYVKKNIIKLAEKYHFIGPINIQCFVDKNNIKFIEVNPRVGGGMSLSWKATENWFSLWFDKLQYKKQVDPKPINYGLKMYRYYSEIFIK